MDAAARKSRTVTFLVGLQAPIAEPRYLDLNSNSVNKVSSVFVNNLYPEWRGLVYF